MNDKELLALEGYVKVFRCILYSDIWDKPAEYLKIFLYILLKVNHKKHKIDRGANIFNFSDEVKNIPFVTKSQIYNFLRWAKSDRVKMINTHKTTRGVILKLNAYELWQDLDLKELQNNCNSHATYMLQDIQEHENVIISSTHGGEDLKNKIVCGQYQNVIVTQNQLSTFVNKVTKDEKLANGLINQLSEKIEMGDSRYKPFDKNFPNAHFIALQKFFKQYTKNLSDMENKKSKSQRGKSWQI